MVAMAQSKFLQQNQQRFLVVVETLAHWSLKVTLLSPPQVVVVTLAHWSLKVTLLSLPQVVVVTLAHWSLKVTLLSLPQVVVVTLAQVVLLILTHWSLKVTLILMLNRQLVNQRTLQAAYLQQETSPFSAPEEGAHLQS